jgi:competence protein ComEA
MTELEAYSIFGEFANPPALELADTLATHAPSDTFVGPVTAQAILSWRQQHGRFSRIEELQEVDGIGPKTYAQIAPHVRV